MGRDSSPLLDRSSQCVIAKEGETTNAHIGGFSFHLTETLNFDQTVLSLHHPTIAPPILSFYTVTYTVMLFIGQRKLQQLNVSVFDIFVNASVSSLFLDARMNDLRFVLCFLAKYSFANVSTVSLDSTEEPR